MTELNLNPSFFVEFQLSVLEKRFDKKELRDLIHDQLTPIVDQKDILGIQLHPDAYPTKAFIQCISKKTVEDLILKGIDIEDTHVDLSEPGYGALKVFVHNAPLDFPNASIKEWLERFGELTNFRDELYINPTGDKTYWKTGTRSALIRLFDVETTVPPHDFLTYGTRKCDISVYHFGQMDRYCRFCKRNVPKSHECDKVSKKSCFKCGQDGHIKANCPKNRGCTNCRTHGHISRDCPVSDDTVSRETRRAGGKQPVTTFITGKKRDADALKSPAQGFQGAPGTPAPSEISTQAIVHAEFVDEEGFSVDRATRKKMIKAKRRDPKYASTPKDGDEIKLISSEKVSPKNKKQKLASGTMNIKNMFSNMLKVFPGRLTKA